MSNIQLTQIPAFRRGYRFQWEPAQNCHVLLYPEGMIKLNESAAAVLTEVDGTRSVGAIVADLQVRYPEAEGIQEDIVAFLEVAVEDRFWIELLKPGLRAWPAALAAGGADLSLPSAVSVLLQSAGLRPQPRRAEHRRVDRSIPPGTRDGRGPAWLLRR